MNSKIGIGLIVMGLIIFAGSTLVYTNPILGHKVSLAISQPQKQMTAGVQESSESEIPVIVQLDISPMLQRKPGAMAVATQRQRVLSMARPLSVAYGLEIKDAHPLFGMISGKVSINNRQALYQDPRVLKVARDRVVRVPSESVDFQAEYMSFKQVSTELNLENLWRKVGKGEGVSVCVLDSGVDRSVVDVEKAWGVGDYPASDSFGHGTPVASVVSESAPQANIYSLRVLDSTGHGRSSDIISALEKVVENVPRPVVVNMSLGTGNALFNPLEKACEMAESYQGITIVAAAGNTGGSVLSPASSPATIAVGALNAEGNLAEYSNRGDKLSAVSYGDVSVTGLGGKQESVRGTSFSSPRVAAMIVCKLSSEKNVGDLDEGALIKDSSVDMGVPGKDPQFGWGLVSGGPMSTAPVSEEKPLGGNYPVLAMSSLGLIGMGVIVAERGT